MTSRSARAPAPAILVLTALVFATMIAGETFADPVTAAPAAKPSQAIRVRGPSIGEVLAATYAAAGLEHPLAPGLVRRARLGGLVPWLTVRTGRNISWQSDDPTIDKGMVLEVRATWRLDRLVFERRELQIASLEAARRRERRRLARRAIRAYFAWQRAASRVLDPIDADDPAATRANAIAADEAAAELDALTDGWFSSALARSRRTASETRTPPKG